MNAVTASSVRPIHLATGERHASMRLGAERRTSKTSIAISSTTMPTMFAATNGMSPANHVHPRRMTEPSRNIRSVSHGITAP